MQGDFFSQRVTKITEIEQERVARKKEERRKAKRARVWPETRLILTSLMDMFTIILCFLLKSYSADPVNIQQSEELELPKSNAYLKVEPAVTIGISENSILVNDKRVVEVKQGAVDPSQKRDGANGFFITPLYDRLSEEAQNQKLLAARNPAVQFTGLAMILGHKTIPFRLLTEVLYTAGQAEFGQFKFAVVKTGQR
jgi:hypothetical protein